MLIREGSCAKDADALLPILDAYTSATVGLCSDDRNPYDIAAEGHISYIVDKALRAGHEPADVFRAAGYAPARMYGLDDRGAIAPGFAADFVLVRPKDGSVWKSGVNVESCYKRGRKVDPVALKKIAEARPTAGAGHNLRMNAVTPADFQVAAPKPGNATAEARVIGVIPHQILTNDERHTLAVEATGVAADLKQDVLKLAVFERHHGTQRRSIAFVRGMKLKSGAIATSINHDSHNVICVGSSDAAMAAAVNYLREIDGGIVVVSDSGKRECLALPIGGLMTDADPEVVTEALRRLKGLAREIGCELEEPFLQLSFLALPVIPSLKITDRGLVDVTAFALVPPVS